MLTFLNRLRNIKTVALHDAESYGVLTAVRILAYHILRWACSFNTFLAVELRLADVNPEFLQLPNDLTGRFLTTDEIEAIPTDPNLETSVEFVLDVLGRSDLCYGIFQDKALIAYGWYSRIPTPIDEHLMFYFPETHVYMYKGFTLKSHRGRRLHAYVMALALEKFTAEGYVGLASFVLADNIRSVRSCARLGYRFFGRIYTARLFNRMYIFATPSCKRKMFVFKQI